MIYPLILLIIPAALRGVVNGTLALITPAAAAQRGEGWGAVVRRAAQDRDGIASEVADDVYVSA